MTALKEIYENYYAKSAEVRSKAKPFAGIWGMGDDPRKDPCHQMFYDAAQEWTNAFAASGPDAAAALEAVRWILQAPLDHQGEDAYWYLYAAHGLVKPLIPRLGAADCKALAAWYDASFPKKARFPVQQEVLKLLKKHGK